MNKPNQNLGAILGAVSRLWFEALLLAVCVLVIIEGLAMPKSTYDIVGAARTPMFVAGSIIVLLGFRLVFELIGAGGAERRPVVWKDLLVPALFVAAIIAYVVLLAKSGIPFFLLTGVFVTITAGLVAHRFDWKLAGLSLGAGLAFGYAVQLVFTRILVLDLPT